MSRLSSPLWPRLSIPHLYSFEASLELEGVSLASSRNWDRLRMTPGAFGLTEDRGEWAFSAISNDLLSARARLIVSLAGRLGTQGIASFGVGTATLEYLIKSFAPQLRVRCMDYADASVSRLRTLFPECDDIAIVDMNATDWVVASDEAALLHRVDAELSDAQWRHVFTRFADMEVANVIFAPCGVLTPRATTSELRTWITGTLRGQRVMRAGTLRSRASMRALFDHAYQVAEVHPDRAVPVWLLSKR